jgi:alginate O-acetyltransferase complex protein AlgI
MQTATLRESAVHGPRERPFDFVACGIAGAGVVEATTLRPIIPGWAEMWLVAGSLFLLFKWLTWSHRSAAQTANGVRSAGGYFFGWVGLDAEEFCRAPCSVKQSAGRDWAFAAGKALLGAVVLWGLIRHVPAERPILIGSLGFAGLLLFLHFGLFHLLALVWQQRGVAVEPIMRRPLLATSLADFWGQRWNRAYRRVSFDFFFRPAISRFGVPAGTVIAFLASGLIHELAISFPAGAGYGGPTVYFVVQGTGLLLERTSWCRRWTRSFPFWGWLYTLSFVVAPVGLLFHEPFLTRVIVPFLAAIGAR